MPSWRFGDDVVGEWRRYREERFQNNEVSLNQVCLELAEQYSCHPSTIRFHLDPAHANQERIRSRARSRRRYAYLKQKKQYARNRWLTRRSKPAFIDSKRAYEKQYRRLTRNPRRYLSQIFSNDRTEAGLTEITNDIREICNGVRFQPSTILRILENYEEAQQNGNPKCRGPPYLERVNLFEWRYSGQ